MGLHIYNLTIQQPQYSWMGCCGCLPQMTAESRMQIIEFVMNLLSQMATIQLQAETPVLDPLLNTLLDSLMDPLLDPLFSYLHTYLLMHTRLLTCRISNQDMLLFRKSSLWGCYKLRQIKTCFYLRLYVVLIVESQLKHCKKPISYSKRQTLAYKKVVFFKQYCLATVWRVTHTLLQRTFYSRGILCIVKSSSKNSLLQIGLLQFAL